MQLNWGAILLAGFADWVLGAAWFTVFGNPWMAGLRMAPEELQAHKAHPGPWPYVISLLCSILMAYAIAGLLIRSKSHTLFRGIGIGILVGIVAAFAMVTDMVFEARVPSFILISAAYPLVGCILMGIILGVWKPKTKVEPDHAAAVAR